MPYTHWAYFDNEDDARLCADDLAAMFDALCAVDPPLDAESDWLLRAARNVDTDTDWHVPVEALVEAYGGKYDGGEATYHKGTGEPIRAADS